MNDNWICNGCGGIGDECDIKHDIDKPQHVRIYCKKCDIVSKHKIDSHDMNTTADLIDQQVLINIYKKTANRTIPPIIMHGQYVLYSDGKITKDGDRVTDPIECERVLRDLGIKLGKGN